MSRSLSASVWERAAGEDRLSKRSYVILFMLLTVAGLAVTAATAALSWRWQPSWMLFVGVFVSGLVGVIVVHRSSSSALSLLGYAMVAVPFGLLLGPVAAHYDSVSVAKILTVTVGMAVGLGLLGALWPCSLESWGAWLFGALLLLVLGSTVTLLSGAFGLQVQGAMRVWDWIAVVIFSGCIVHDVNNAMLVPRTPAYAIQAAISIYLGVLNLFMRLLSLFGSSSDD